jgi:hypothetical protein
MHPRAAETTSPKNETCPHDDLSSERDPALKWTMPSASNSASDWGGATERDQTSNSATPSKAFDMISELDGPAASGAPSSGTTLMNAHHARTSKSYVPWEPLGSSSAGAITAQGAAFADSRSVTVSPHTNVSHSMFNDLNATLPDCITESPRLMSGPRTPHDSTPVSQESPLQTRIAALGQPITALNNTFQALANYIQGAENPVSKAQRHQNSINVPTQLRCHEHAERQKTASSSKHQLEMQAASKSSPTSMVQEQTPTALEPFKRSSVMRTKCSTNSPRSTTTGTAPVSTTSSAAKTRKRTQTKPDSKPIPRKPPAPSTRQCQGTASAGKGDFQERIMRPTVSSSQKAHESPLPR